MSDFGSDRDDQLSYSFTITSGAVTAEDVVRNGHTHEVHLSSIDSFTIGTGPGSAMVTETIKYDSATVTVDYALEAGSTTLYQVVGRSYTVTDPTGALPNGGTLTYSFTLSSGGAVTGETETVTLGSSAITHTVDIPADAIFTTGAGWVTKTWISGDQVMSTTYNELKGTTNYVFSESSSNLIVQGSATTELDIRPNEQALFTIASSGTVTAAELVRPDGDTVTITPDSHYALTVLAPGYVEAVVGDGNHTHFAVYYNGSATGGTYTEIAHGSGSAVDLVGLKAQIAELPSALAATI